MFLSSAFKVLAAAPYAPQCWVSRWSQVAVCTAPPALLLGSAAPPASACTSSFSPNHFFSLLLSLPEPYFSHWDQGSHENQETPRWELWTMKAESSRTPVISHKGDMWFLGLTIHCREEQGRTTRQLVCGKQEWTWLLLRTGPRRPSTTKKSAFTAKKWGIWVGITTHCSWHETTPLKWQLLGEPEVKTTSYVTSAGLFTSLNMCLLIFAKGILMYSSHCGFVVIITNVICTKYCTILNLYMI